ncbi:Uncharacterised protein [Vibrio cholerae]|nr:Uncharacterised protein [Vibrio cholerae]
MVFWVGDGTSGRTTSADDGIVSTDCNEIDQPPTARLTPKPSITHNHAGRAFGFATSIRSIFERRE